MILLLAACSVPENLLREAGPDTAPAATSSEVPDVSALAVDSPAGVVLVGDVAFADLQDALDAAEPGDIVAVGAGRYVGAFVVEVPITLGGIGAVVLDAAGQGTVLTVAPGTRILDLVLTGGHGDDGGGIAMRSAGELVVARTTLTGNTADQGGGLWVAPGSLTWLVDATVTGNSARDGGGIACLQSEVFLVDSAVTANDAANGGGIYADRCSIDGGTWSANRADGDGGGLALLESLATGLTVADNEAVYGGGVYSFAGALSDSVVERNVADEGAGIFSVSGMTLADTRILDHDGVGLAIGTDRVEMVGGAVLGNVVGAESSGGLGQELTSTDTNWGTSGSDNTYDVAWGFDAFGFGAAATFTCAGAACAR